MYLYVTPRYHIQILSLGEYVKKHKMSAIFWHLEIHEQTLTERLQKLPMSWTCRFLICLLLLSKNTNIIPTPYKRENVTMQN